MKALGIALVVTLVGATLAAQQTTPAETPRGNEFHVYFNEGDQVVQIAQRWMPDPGASGSFYEAFEWLPNAARVAPPVAPKVPSPGCSATPAQLEANKKLAAGFWRDGITPPERIGLVDSAYVQHNPLIRRFAVQYRVPDFQALTFFATRGGIQQPRPPIKTASGQTLTPTRVERSIAACDVVMQIHKFYNQSPAGSGNWVEQLGWDLFRVRNGKLVEHWDGSPL